MNTEIKLERACPTCGGYGRVEFNLGGQQNCSNCHGLGWIPALREEPPRNYYCKCCECGEFFDGHKRSVVCKKCFDENQEEPAVKVESVEEACERFLAPDRNMGDDEGKMASWYESGFLECAKWLLSLTPAQLDELRKVK